MEHLDYLKALVTALRKLEELSNQREELDVQIANLRQFIRATMNMLPDEEREDMEKAFGYFAERQVGLTDAIRSALRNNANTWMTAVKVRDYLKSTGFDFSSYAANPLASIHTVLKRFKPEEVEMGVQDDVTAYRWKQPKPRFTGSLTYTPPPPPPSAPIVNPPNRDLLAPRRREPPKPTSPIRRGFPFAPIRKKDGESE